MIWHEIARRRRRLWAQADSRRPATAGAGWARARLRTRSGSPRHEQSRRAASAGSRWGCSSAGRAPRSHRGGQGFESPHLHHLPHPGPSYRCPRAPSGAEIPGAGISRAAREARDALGPRTASSSSSPRTTPPTAPCLTRLLERAGYRSIAVADGRDAVRAAIEENPDLVLLDVGLPGLNGLDVCRRLRARSREPSPCRSSS